MTRASIDALVTDMHAASAVSGLRGLGRAGLRTLAVGPGRLAGGLWSRYAVARAVVPGANVDAPGFAAGVARLAAANGSPLVYPGGERALSALLDAPTTRPPPRLPYPDDAERVLSSLRDKRQLGRLADDAGLRVPATLAESPAATLADAGIATPAVVKPACPGDEPGTARIVESAAGLEALLTGIDGRTPLLVQERLRGRLVVLAIVLDREHRPVASFQQTVLRTWPRGAGTSTLAVSVSIDDELMRRSASMLAAAGYWGLAQLDFLVDDHGAALIDVNPRFYTSLPLALACGVNLPAAWHAVASGDRVAAAGDYPTGRRYRWLEGDLTAVARGSIGALRRGVSAPGAGAMWAADDPVPSALLALGAISVRVRRRIPGRRR